MQAATRDRSRLLAVTALAPLVVGGTIYFVLLACGGAAREGGWAGSMTTRVAGGTVATPDVEIMAENGSFVLVAGSPFTTPASIQCRPNPAPENYGDAEAAGATRVRVRYPGLATPLYGIIAFCQIADSYRGSASRSYRVEVPQSYVDATDGGRVSTVFEQYTVDNVVMPAWILWLSRESMPPQAPTPAPSGGGC